MMNLCMFHMLNGRLNKLSRRQNNQSYINIDLLNIKNLHCIADMNRLWNKNLIGKRIVFHSTLNLFDIFGKYQISNIHHLSYKHMLTWLGPMMIWLDKKLFFCIMYLINKILSCRHKFLLKTLKNWLGIQWVNTWLKLNSIDKKYHRHSQSANQLNVNLQDIFNKVRLMGQDHIHLCRYIQELKRHRFNWLCKD